MAALRGRLFRFSAKAVARPADYRGKLQSFRCCAGLQLRTGGSPVIKASGWHGRRPVN